MDGLNSKFKTSNAKSNKKMEIWIGYNKFYLAHFIACIYWVVCISLFYFWTKIEYFSVQVLEIFAYRASYWGRRCSGRSWRAKGDCCGWTWIIINIIILYVIKGNNKKGLTYHSSRRGTSETGSMNVRLRLRFSRSYEDKPGGERPPGGEFEAWKW